MLICSEIPFASDTAANLQERVKQVFFLSSHWGFDEKLSNWLFNLCFSWKVLFHVETSRIISKYMLQQYVKTNLGSPAWKRSCFARRGYPHRANPHHKGSKDWTHYAGPFLCIF